MVTQRADRTGGLHNVVQELFADGSAPSMMLVRLTKISSGISVLLLFPVNTVGASFAPSLGSRKGFFDIVAHGSGNCVLLGSALRGDSEAVVRLRKGLFEERFNVSPAGWVVVGGEGWRSAGRKTGCLSVGWTVDRRT